MSTIETPCHLVEPSQITKALQQLWRECCDTDSADVVRSLTHNLVIVIDKDKLAEINARLLQLVEHQPCRAFVVMFDDSKQLTACVHGTARDRDASRDLLLEQIDLTVPTDKLDSLVGVVRPLLVNDIPTTVLWSTEWPQQTQHFDQLCNMADHALIDSAWSATPDALMDKLADRSGKPVTDLAWLRVKSWRRALAEALERASFRKDMDTHVTIRHGQQALAGALQLGRWLETRLGAEVQLETVDNDSGPTPVSIEIQNGSTLYALEQRQRQIEIAVQEKESWSRPFSVPSVDATEAALLAQALAL